MKGLKGRLVQVFQAVFGRKDAHGNVSKSYSEPIDVYDVLIAPGDPTPDIEDGRPYGVEILYTLYLPKGIDLDFRGAKIAFSGEEFDVVGDPRPYPSELVPGKRNLVVKVVRHEG